MLDNRFRLVLARQSFWTTRPARLAACLAGVLAGFLAAVGAVHAQPQSSAEARASFTDAALFQNAGKFDLAADEYAEFLKRFPKDPLAPKARHYLGVCQYQLNKPAEAVETLARVVADHAEFELLDETYFYLGLAHFRVGEASGEKSSHEKAAAALGVVSGKFPKSKFVPQAIYFTAESHYAAGNFKQAVDAYKTLLDKHADSELVADAMYGLGWAYEELQQYAEAEKVYAGFLRKFADHDLASEVRLRQGETLLARGQFAAAEPHFARAAEDDAFSAADWALFQQATCAFEQGQLDKAGDLYLALPKRFPESDHAPLAWMNAGKSYYRTSRFDAARQAFTSVLPAGKELAVEAAHLIARCLLAEGMPAEAAAVAEKHLAQAAGTEWEASLRMDRADAVYAMADRRKEAVALYAAVAEQHAEHSVAPEALYMAAATSLQLQDADGASKYAERFVRTYADHELAASVRFTLASARLLEGAYEDAEELLRGAIAARPNDANAPLWKLRLGHVLHLREKSTDAVNQLTPVVKELKEPVQVAEAQYWIGAAQHRLGRLEPALAAYRASLAAAPAGPLADRVLLATAECHAAGQSFDQAIAAAQLLIKDHPQSSSLPEAVYRLGVYLGQAGKRDEAVAQFDAVVRRWPESTFAPYATHALSVQHFSAKDYAAAERLLTALLTAHPDHTLAVTARFDRAQARQLQEKYTEAVADVTAVLAADPPAHLVSPARHVLGICQDRLKQPAEAAKTFEQLLTDDPQYAGKAAVLNELAWSLKGAGQEQQALAAFKRLVDEHGNSPLAAEAHFILGETSYAEKAYDKALASYEAALACEPGGDLLEKVLHKLGWASFRLRQFDKAQGWFEKQLAAAASGSAAADAQYMLAESLFQQKKYDQVLAAYKKAEEKKPSSDTLHQVVLLHAGQSAAQLQQWKESIAVLAQLIEKYPESYYVPEALYEQGWAHKNLADAAAAADQKPASDALYVEALKLLDTTAEKTQRAVGARARFMMGEIYFARQDHREAIRNLFKAARGYGYPNAAQDTQVWQAKACYELGRVHSVIKDIGEAQKWYREVVDRYPDSPEAAEATRRLAELSAKSG